MTVKKIVDGVAVKCSNKQCRHHLGRFATIDDHGGIEMCCPACRTWNFIANERLSNRKPGSSMIATSAD